MTGTELNRIRKRLDPQLSNFKNIYGCYVNAAGEKVSDMSLPVADMAAEEREMYASLFKKSLSGPIGKHLLQLSFSTEQVAGSDEHRLLSALKESHAEAKDMRDVLYERIMGSLDLDGKSYVILLTADTYDITSKDGDEDWSEDSESQFEYILCSICLVKDPKAILRYDASPKAFRGNSTGSVLAGPAAGFMFPAFEDNAANIYSVMYYSKSKDDCHEELIEALFGISDPPMPAELQKTVFSETLSQTLGADCSLEVITGLQAKIAAKLDGNEDEGSLYTPKITFDEVGDILKAKGVPEAKIEAFSEAAEKRFGSDEPLTAQNLLQTSAYRITSSEATISVKPEQAVRIKTKEIDGVRYFLVPVGSDVKVNGIDITL